MCSHHHHSNVQTNFKIWIRIRIWIRRNMSYSQRLKYFVLFRTHTLYINLQAQYILYFVCSHHHFNVQSFKFKCCCCPCGPDILTVAPLVRVKALPWQLGHCTMENLEQPGGFSFYWELKKAVLRPFGPFCPEWEESWHLDALISAINTLREAIWTIWGILENVSREHAVSVHLGFHCALSSQHWLIITFLAPPSQ